MDACTSSHEVCSFRTNDLKAFLQSEAELRKEEEPLHRTLHPEAARVLKGKRLQFPKLAQTAGVQDDSLFRQICDSFKIFGLCRALWPIPRLY